MQANRRVFLKGSLAASAVGVAVGAGLLSPRAVMAAWPEAAFKADSISGALSEIMGGAATESADVTLRAPDIAENGAVVPITVETNMSDVKQIAILVEGNPQPLVTNFDVSGAAPFLSTRIRMGETSDVYGVVQTGAGVFEAHKEVKVTIGGCGG